MNRALHPSTPVPTSPASKPRRPLSTGPRIEERTYTHATRNQMPVEMVTVDFFDAQDVHVGRLGPMPVDSWFPILDRLNGTWSYGIDRGDCGTCGRDQHLGQDDCTFLASVSA